VAPRAGLAAALLLASCTPDPGAPFWALDPVALYPEGDAVYGLQTWEVFGERWGRRFQERWYICSVVVEFDGSPTEPCEGCTHAWAVEPAFVESDCPDATAEQANFLDLTHVGIGGPAPTVESDDPHPGESIGAWADYGEGWTEYGWAYPQALDEGGDGGAWDETAPFTLWPAWAWEL